MKRTLVGLVSAVALGLAVQTHAIMYDFTFTQTGGPTTAIGTIDVVSGLAVSGYINILTGPQSPGLYTLVPGAGNNGHFLWDSVVDTAGAPWQPPNAFDSNGLEFITGTTEINFWGNRDGSYSLWGWTPDGGFSPQATGTSILTLATVPDGGLTAALLGMGMLGLGWLRRMVK